jgi:preprotein translocase subunit SecE
MAFIGRKQTTAPATAERPKPRPTAAPQQQTGRVAKLRVQVRDIMAELRKVTWPTREETRNLTIVVIGISVFLGALLGGLDFILAYVYQALNTAIK